MGASSITTTATTANDPAVPSDSPGPSEAHADTANSAAQTVVLPETVAKQFTNVYYLVMERQPHRLAELYGPDSQLSHDVLDGVSENVEIGSNAAVHNGRSEIAAAAAGLPLAAAGQIASIRSVDAMTAGNGAYIVLVTGALEGAPFAQTFLLARAGTNDDAAKTHFYCRSDVFRYIREPAAVGAIETATTNGGQMTKDKAGSNNAAGSGASHARDPKKSAAADRDVKRTETTATAAVANGTGVKEFDGAQVSSSHEEAKVNIVPEKTGDNQSTEVQNSVSTTASATSDGQNSTTGAADTAKDVDDDVDEKGVGAGCEEGNRVEVHEAGSEVADGKAGTTTRPVQPGNASTPTEKPAAAVANPKPKEASPEKASSQERAAATATPPAQSDGASQSPSPTAVNNTKSAESSTGKAVEASPSTSTTASAQAKPAVMKSWASIVSTSTTPASAAPAPAASTMQGRKDGTTAGAERTGGNDKTVSPAVPESTANADRKNAAGQNKDQDADQVSEGSGSTGRTPASDVVTQRPNAGMHNTAYASNGPRSASGTGRSGNTPNAPGAGGVRHADHASSNGGWSSVENKRHGYGNYHHQHGHHNHHGHSHHQAHGQEDSAGFRTVGNSHANGHGYQSHHHHGGYHGYRANGPRTYGPSAVIQLNTLPRERLGDWRLLVEEFTKEFGQYGHDVRHVDVKTQKLLAFVEYETVEGVRAAVAAWSSGPRDSGPFAGVALNVSEKRPKRHPMGSGVPGHGLPHDRMGMHGGGGYRGVMRGGGGGGGGPGRGGPGGRGRGRGTQGVHGGHGYHTSQHQQSQHHHRQHAPPSNHGHTQTPTDASS